MKTARRIVLERVLYRPSVMDGEGVLINHDGFVLDRGSADVGGKREPRKREMTMTPLC